MRQTLAQLIDGCMSRISNPSKIGENAYIEEINHATEELFSKIRDQRGDWLIRQTYLDIQSGKDSYQLPAFVGDVKSIERRTDEESGGYRLLNRIPIERSEEWHEIYLTNFSYPEQYSYLPGGSLLLRPTPTMTIENALRVTYNLRFVPMVNMEDVPEAPQELHEWIVCGALDRLRQYADVTIPKQEELEGFMARQADRLARFIAPTYIDQPARIGDEDQFFLNY